MIEVQSRLLESQEQHFQREMPSRRRRDQKIYRSIFAFQGYFKAVAKEAPTEQIKLYYDRLVNYEQDMPGLMKVLAEPSPATFISMKIAGAGFTRLPHTKTIHRHLSALLDPNPGPLRDQLALQIEKDFTALAGQVRKFGLLAFVRTVKEIDGKR